MNQKMQWQEPVGSIEADSVKDLSLDKRGCLPLCSVGESCWCLGRTALLISYSFGLASLKEW